MALRTGLRRGELYGLRWVDIDLDRREASVLNTRTRVSGTGQIVEGSTKSGRPRSVGLPDSVVAALRVMPSRFARGYVFSSRDGEPLAPDSEKRVFAKVKRAAKIERHVRFHDLRHTWASHLAMRGVTLAVIQQLGGWQSHAMVLRYAHLSRESVVRAVDCLDAKEIG